MADADYKTLTVYVPAEDSELREAVRLPVGGHTVIAYRPISASSLAPEDIPVSVDCLLIDRRTGTDVVVQGNALKESLSRKVSGELVGPVAVLTVVVRWHAPSPATELHGPGECRNRVRTKPNGIREAWGQAFRSPR